MTTKTTKEWLDVTYPIKEGMVHWPGQPPVELTRLSELAQGDSSNVSALTLSLHTGTHIDAPKHFLEGAEDITAAPLDALLGEAWVAHLEDAAEIGESEVAAFEARCGALQRGDRVLFRTRNSKRNWLEKPFAEDYVAVNPGGARYLASKGVQVVGVDYLSVAPFENTTDTHRILLGARVWVIEGLDLRNVTEGRYEMIALPLKIETGDASPLRVLLREVDVKE